ncbi:MAG TPA: 4Fe-4S binding protein [Chitinophagaceae bacterium]|nr:4Fe-4S binding protein [Chitinophagaceae bacterium]HQV06475.1 4Fe-4S binding protein [Chitinophagaceae bacterium]
MKFITKYIKEVWLAIKSLFVGMRRTGYYFTHHKEIITQEYPDNKDSLILPKRFKGEVVMPHNENNEHRCTGCQACEIACPNGSLKVVTEFNLLENGRKKKAIDKLVYHLELCTMCNLCVEACPSDAIIMDQTFEHSVFDRNELIKVLNKPGSKIMDGVE